MKFLSSTYTGPIHQVNLVKFKKQTKDGRSGELVYKEYMKRTIELVEKVGGKMIWIGTPMKEGPLVGTDIWDRILIAEYPSKEVFIKMAASPDYKSFSHLREEALEMAIVPTRDQVLKFLASPYKGTVHQVNLLKFKDRTVSGVTGEESYKKYGEKVGKLVQKVGGRIIWVGIPMKEGPLVGTDLWDRMLIVEYPNKEAFVTMSSSAEYKEIAHLREDSLEIAQLIPTVPLLSKL
ncbi:hypothetical protein HK103_003998 [Boothiomyces macroporosus]|uniref:DUF1330 domain-containing protein n=1 Tax=Boothiomyces macroporosus TaxID=261099 RepID=A0AAD5UI52_9FUNG|nr:hypothetical protein HK103_003998 [Boothiomyces macroporosus]